MAGIDYTVTDNWGTGFVAEMKVKPGTSALNGWTVEFDAPFAINNIWNAEIVSHVGNHYVVRNAAWNGGIAAGQEVSFGFQAAGNTAATGLSLNGAGVGQPPAPPSQPLPSLTIGDATVSEGNSGTQDLAFTVRLSAPSTGPVTVAYTTANGTATAGADYTATTGTLTFAAGETVKTIHVQVTGDSTVESDEGLSLTLSAPTGATIASGTARGTIVNDDVAPTPPPPTPPAATAWQANAVYTSGMTVVENGVTYRANWWTQGVDPAQNSSRADTGTPWTVVAGGSDAATAWTANGVYTSGMQVIENGVIYQAKWWTQGSDPAHNSGNGQPWSIVGAADPAHVVPSVPTGLVAHATSATSAMLSWNAATVPGNAAPVTGYAIFENGHQVATTTGTSYTLTDLSANTTYQFSVTALDAAGSSAQAAPISVHTPSLLPPVDHGIAEHHFAPYIDMAMVQGADLVGISHASGIENFTLAFVLGSSQGIGWQGVGTIADDTLYNGTTILSQVQAIQAAGGHITISFGGAAGQEAALTAPNASVLQAEYQSVIDRYHIDSIDFDIEGWAVQHQQSITMRDQAIVGLQAANPDLKVSFTLPVLPTGLVADGLNLLRSAMHDGVRIDLVNIMAMDYGPGVDNGGQMGLNAINAAIATEHQLAALGLNAKIGITPMIGVNDVASEVFTLADARALLAFAESDPNVARLSMWSVARDNGGSAGAHYAAPDSSGVAQQPFEFAGILHQFDLG